MDDVNPFAAPQTLELRADDAPPADDTAALRMRHLHREVSLRALAVTKLLTVAGFIAFGVSRYPVVDVTSLLMLAPFHAALAWGLWRLAGLACALQRLISGAMLLLALILVIRGLGGDLRTGVLGMLLLTAHAGAFFVVTSNPTKIVCSATYRDAVARSPQLGTSGQFFAKLLVFVIAWVPGALAYLLITFD